MASQDAASTNDYPIDIEEPAETARLIEQDRLITQAWGGLFAAPLDLTAVRQVLDIGCGPGGWVINVAFEYPEWEVLGIDINPSMINYAQATALAQGCSNVSFEVMNAKHPLAFADASFDLVNARTIFGFMDKVSWPKLLAECLRILRPGGILCMSEPEFTASNSPAYQKLYDIMNTLSFQQQRSFSVDGHSFGISYMLKSLLRRAGFEQVEHHASAVEASSGTPLHYNYTKDMEVAFILMKPYMIASGLIEDSEFERLHRAMQIEMRQDDFTAFTFGLSVWGNKAR